MSDTKPNDAFNDELLSAYVDGELSGEQLAQVEQQLRDDPKAKQLVAELRALSTSLQAMPRETVGTDLREAILQRAERSPRTSTTGGARRWIWAAMALAAVLLLMVVQPEAEQDGQHLASLEKEQQQAEFAEQELRAPAVGPIKSKQVVAEEEMITAKSLPATATLDADESGSFGNDAPLLTKPVREVHLVLAEGAAEFDKLLASHGLTRIDAPSFETNKEQSRQRKAVPSRRLETLSKADGEVAGIEKILVEGTAKQIEKLLADHQQGTNFFADSSGISSRNSFASGASSASQEIENLPRGDDLPESLTVNESSPFEIAEENVQFDNAAKVEAVERIRILFVIHPQPSTPNKKARSSKKVDGKEG